MIAFNAIHAEITWTLSDDGTLTISGTGDMSYYNPYATYPRYSPWYSKRNKIKNAVIEYGVADIGSYAFWECSNLATITIPNSVTSIGRGAFSGCLALCSITIPNSVTNIGNSAFYSCSGLTSVTIGNSVTSIGESAFMNCSSLTSITIPNSVTSIGVGAFFECSGLTSIIVEQGNKNYDSRNNCNAIIEKESNTLVAGCKKTVIPNSVTSIGDYAFYWCTGLKSVTIPNSVTSIGKKAFDACYNIASATLGMKNIPNKIFYDRSSLSSLTILDGATSIGDSAFYKCSGLTSVTIPNSVTSIGKEAFQECSGLTSITIPNSVTCIERGTFCASGLTSITIPNSVTSIGFAAFASCPSLTSITIPNSVTNIGENAFYNCPSLTSITIPNSVTSLGDYAFYNCPSLTSITIPNSVTSIGNKAFDGTKWYYNQPDGLIYAGHVLYKYKGTMPANSKIVIKEGTTVIANYAFAYCTGLTSVTIPNSVTNIGGAAFAGCSGLTSIIIPNSVTNIGDAAFAGCSGLTSITIPNSVTSIGYRAFAECTGLTSVTIPNSVTSIGDYAFEDCSGLTSITIPNSVTSIGTRAFEDCSGLTSITCEASTPPNCYSNYYSNSFRYVNKNIPVYVPAKSVNVYKNADGWKDFTNIQAIIIEPANISLADASENLIVGMTKKLEATITPEDATTKTITWTSSNTDVATVSSEGIVTAKGGGTTVITATTNNGKTAKCTITVEQPVTAIVLNVTLTSLWVGKTKTLTATVTPTTSSNTAVNWSSSDNNVATVSSKGIVTAKGQGTCTITCTAADGYGTKSTCEITVKQQVAEITLSETTASLWVGDTKTITATTSPTTASNTAVEWSSSDDKVANVSSEGVITANGEGSCIITCSAVDGYGTKTTCEVTVKQQVTEIALSETTASLWVGDTKTITATATPTTASNTSVEWYSSDDNVASVSSDGVITAKGKGTCTITCTAADGYGTKSTCEVTVKQQVTEITLSETNASLWVGETKTITTTTTPTTASNTSVEWSSSDDNVATVSSDGVITAIGEGTCTITCTASDGYGTKSTCEVSVKQQVTEIALSETTASLWVGDTKTITATTSPITASNPSVEWSSSDDKVATVSSEGVITANGEGTCIITCTAADGYGTKSICEVIVKQQVTEIALSETNASLWVDETKTITATALPTTASNTSVEWSSSDDNVATVSSDGVITAKGEGTCIITCTAADGYGIKSTCEITVKQQVTEIVLSETTVSLCLGDTKTITATATLETASNTDVIWSSSDENVATVSADGIVTAKGEGTCIITCTAADGYGTVSVCEVTVMQQATSLEDLRFANDKSPVYNLNGQRISKAHALKGVYIKNGKKYANKN